jgi:hypothetical protein
MNIIYDINSNTLRAANHKDGAIEALSKTNFYIPKDFNLPLYCRLKDAFGKENIFKLTPAPSQNKNYTTYVISTNNSTINALDKTVQLSLFYFVNDTFQNSESLTIDFEYDMYNYSVQLSIIRGVSKEITEMYDKIRKLTDLNIDMYKEIEEAFEEVNK